MIDTYSVPLTTIVEKFRLEVAFASTDYPHIQLTVEDVERMDTDPAALGRKLVQTTAGKCWQHHPRAESFLAQRVALLQRVYRRG